MGYHIDDGRIFDANNPTKGIEYEGKGVQFFSPRSRSIELRREVNDLKASDLRNVNMGNKIFEKCFLKQDKE